MIEATLTVRRTGGLCVIRYCGQREGAGETLHAIFRIVRH
jgi:hypothetical protein